MGAILELEGVLLEWPDYGNLGLHAWEQLAQELGKPPPPKWALRRAEGMKNEQVRDGGGRVCRCVFGWDGFCWVVLGRVYVVVGWGVWWWLCGDMGSGRGAAHTGASR